MKIKKILIKIVFKFVSDDDLRYELSGRDYGIVNGSIFKWLGSWIEAFEKDNSGYEGISKKIRDWISKQPSVKLKI